MKSVNRQPILVVEPDGQIREEIFNLLLSAGCENIEETDSLEAALDKIRQAAYEIVVASAGEPLTAGLRFAADVAGISPGVKIIFMIDAENQRSWDKTAAQSANIRFLIKTDFARNLLYLLEENMQP